MAPKKNQKSKMSLGAFLEDSNLGSWADEMDNLPTAPASRDVDSQPGRLGGRAAESGFSRPERAGFPPREDVPLPTQPPYTAFVGNLAFDLTEGELESFFAPSKTKSVKIIKDREDKPKGFGYIEFEELDGLKDAITRSGQNIGGRVIRVSVAEAPKSGFGGSGGGGFGGEDEKFANPWRRDGPLPDLPGRGGSDGPRRRFEGGERPGPPPAVSDGVDQWRSSKPSPRIPPREFDGPPQFERKKSNFADKEPGAADLEDTWSRGSRFKATEETSSPPNRGFGSGFRRSDSSNPPREPPPPSAADEPSTWRGARPARVNNNSTSPTGSTPPTPQMGRRKLELLPRSGGSNVPSPLSSPRMSSAPSGVSTPRSNPFGDARPVDSSAKDKEVTERVEKDREAVANKVQQNAMSRTESRGGFERTPSKTGTTRPSVPPANVRPAVSFASALSSKGSGDVAESAATSANDVYAKDVAEVTEKLESAAV